MVALQNGIIGIVAPSQDESEIRVLTGLHDVAVSFEEASEGKLSKVAQLALSADGMSEQALADSVTGEKRFILPDYGGPGKCVLADIAAALARSVMPAVQRSRLPPAPAFAMPG